jgi:hypothetical protein
VRWRRRKRAPKAVAVEPPIRREKVRDREPLVTEQLNRGRAAPMNDTVQTPRTIPVVCDTTAAPDTVHDRIESYRQLFADALVIRDRVGSAVRFRFRADEGVESQVRRLAALEKQCYAFFTFAINAPRQKSCGTAPLSTMTSPVPCSTNGSYCPTI